MCSFVWAQTIPRPDPATPSTQLHHAIVVAGHGDAKLALAETRSLLATHPNFEAAWKFQGSLLEQMGDGPGATASFVEALRLAPGDAELLLKVGILKLLAGDPEEAVHLLSRRLKLTPHDTDTLYYLAQAHHLKGDNALALQTIQECVKLDPANASVLQKYGELLCSSGDNETALRWLLKAQHEDPTLDRIDFDLGVASYGSMNLDQAQGYATKATHQRPDDPTALALLAAVDGKLGRWKEAEQANTALLSIKPDDISSQLGLGQSELELKAYQPAVDVLERLLRQDPTQILAHFYLSRAYMALGRKDEAQHEAELHRKMLEQGSLVAPEGDTERERAVWIQARALLADGKEQKALDLFGKEAKGPFATPGGAYVLVGVLYLYLDRRDDAGRVLHRALAIEPKVHAAHTYLAELDLEQNDPNGAAAELRAGLADDSNDNEAIAELGEVRYRQGRWSEAVEELTRSHTKAPSLLYMLCDSYFRLGKTKEADLTAELAADYAKSEPQVIRGVIALLQRNQQTELALRLSDEFFH